MCIYKLHFIDNNSLTVPVTVQIHTIYLHTIKYNHLYNMTNLDNIH